VDKAARSGGWQAVVMGLGAFGFYSLGDAAVRGMGQRLPALELAFVGAIVSLLFAPLVAQGKGLPMALVRPKRWSLWLLRGVLAIGGTALGIIAWGSLPLAQTASILFLGPLLTVALTPLILKEKVGVREWIGLFLGLAGVLVVLRPEIQALGPGHFAAMGCAICGAGTTLLIRATRDEETPASMYGAACLSVAAAGAVSLLQHVVIPSPKDCLLLVVFTSCGTVANIILLFVWRLGRAALVAPVQYTQELWGIGLGFVLFSEVPRPTTLAGAALIVFGGILPLIGLDISKALRGFRAE